MTQRAGRGRRSLWLALGLFGSVAVLYVLFPGVDEGDGLPGGPPEPIDREFVGVVEADGRPVAARVTLYEAVAGGYRTEVETDAAGVFTATWTPTATSDARRVFLRVAGPPPLAPAILPVAAAGVRVELAPAVACRGVVVTRAGKPVAGARVRINVEYASDDAAEIVTEATGLFRTARRFPPGARLDLFVYADGFAPRVAHGFRVEDELVVHVAPGRDVELDVRDPRGQPVAAEAALATPFSLVAPAATGTGRVVLPDASDGGVVLVAVHAPGWLPVEAPAWPGQKTEVILWPRRDVTVVAWDAWNRKGVRDVSFDVDLDPPAGEEWWGKNVGRVTRRYPLRVLGAGHYRLSLPDSALTLFLSAPAHGDSKVRVARDETEKGARMDPPRSREKPGELVLRAAADTPDFDLVVAEEGGDWLRRAALRGGRTEVRVPAGQRLQVASVDAIDGRWVPKHTLEEFRAGERRVVSLGTRPAIRLPIDVEPRVDGTVTLVDVEYKRLFPPRTAPLRAGRAEFWVRPFRKLKLSIDPPGLYFVHEGTITTKLEETPWMVRLREAAQLRYRVLDAGGHAIPFSVARVWEPARGGRMSLVGPPRSKRADAAGEVVFDGLRRGAAAVQVEAAGFRTRRFNLVRLATGDVVDGGDVRLEAAPELAGRAVDANGRAVAGVEVRVLAPGVSRLAMPGGGERDLYDLTADAIGDAITGADGRFSVPDESPRHPLVGLFPSTESELAPMAFLPAPDLALHATAYIELDVPGSVTGVYVLLPRARAVLVRRDPPMGLRPLPVRLPAGKHQLYVRLRDGRWAASDVELKAGGKIRLKPAFQR